MDSHHQSPDHTNEQQNSNVTQEEVIHKAALEPAQVDTALLGPKHKFTVVSVHNHDEPDPDICGGKLVPDEDMLDYAMERRRADSMFSQLSATEMGELGILTPIGDAGSLHGSSVILASRSYLDISQRVAKLEAESNMSFGSVGYLDTIIENSEYVDTLQGKLPFAQVARMIAIDKKVTHKELFDVKHIISVRNDCYKRLFIIGLSFLGLSSSYFALRNLQSSSGVSQSLGLITFGCLTSLMWLGGLLAPPIMAKIKPKRTLVAASVPFLLYPLANFYPVEYTLIPCALAAGFGVGLLWNSEGVYMINLASKYAFVSRKPLIEVIGKFNAVIFGLYQCSHILGNVLSSLILQAPWRNNRDLTNLTLYIGVNDTIMIPQRANNQLAVNLSCGIDYYSSFSALPQSTKISATIDSLAKSMEQYILYGILTGLALAAFVNFIIFLKPLDAPKMSTDSKVSDILLNFVKLFKNPRIMLLIPFMMYPGTSGSVAMADYTKIYITCAYGEGFIGYILMTAAIFSITGAILSGRLIAKVGRISLFVTATLFSTSAFLTMLLWQPRSTKIEVMAFIAPSFWCLGDGILLTQINGFLGEMFRQDLGFALSALHICFGLGSALGTFTSAFNWLTPAVKIYCVIGHVWISLTLLVILELLRKFDKL